jgi:hypothetical protein
MIFPLSCSQQSWTLAENPDKGQKKSTSENGTVVDKIYLFRIRAFAFQLNFEYSFIPTSENFVARSLQKIIIILWLISKISIISIILII